MAISQNKSHSPLENWITLKADCRFQERCAACKYACITHLLYLCVHVCGKVCVLFVCLMNHILRITSPEIVIGTGKTKSQFQNPIFSSFYLFVSG